MEFEWDERKRGEVLKERGVDFLYAALIFEGEVLTRIDDRKDYGETRFISIGLVEEECFAVVHTKRQNVVGLITAWKGGRDDRSEYQARIAGRDQEDEGGRKAPS